MNVSKQRERGPENPKMNRPAPKGAIQKVCKPRQAKRKGVMLLGEIWKCLPKNQAKRNSWGGDPSVEGLNLRKKGAFLGGEKKNPDSSGREPRKGKKRAYWETSGRDPKNGKTNKKKNKKETVSTL